MVHTTLTKQKLLAKAAEDAGDSSELTDLIQSFGILKRHIVNVAQHESDLQSDKTILNNGVLSFAIINYNVANQKLLAARGPSYDGTSGGSLFQDGLFLCAAKDFTLFKNLYPNNQTYFTGNNLFYVTISNILIALQKNDHTWLKNEAPLAIEKSLTLKKHGGFEKAGLRFMQAVLISDTDALSTELQTMCKTYKRATTWHTPFVGAKELGLLIHGFHQLAVHTLPVSIGEGIVLPEHEVFSQELARLPIGSPYLTFTDQLAPLHSLYNHLDIS